LRGSGIAVLIRIQVNIGGDIMDQDKEKNYNGKLPEIKPVRTNIDKWKTAGTIFLVVFIGCLAVNQALEFRYRSVFLQGPCKLCADLNAGVKDCIDDLHTARPSFPLRDGTWTDPFTDTKYNLENITR